MKRSDSPFEVALERLGRDNVLRHLPRLERVTIREHLVDLLERVAFGLAEHEEDVDPAGVDDTKGQPSVWSSRCTAGKTHAARMLKAM